MSTQPQPASADDHVFYYSEGDDQPMSSHRPTDPSITENGADGRRQASGMCACTHSFLWLFMVGSSNIDARRIQRAGQGKKMAQALAFEKVDEHGKPVKHYLASTDRKPQKAKRPRIDTGTMVASGSSDEDDQDFEGPNGSESETESDSDSVDMLPSNAEVCHLINVLLELELNHILFMLGC